MFAPVKMRMNVFGMFSKPSCTSTNDFNWPDATQLSRSRAPLGELRGEVEGQEALPCGSRLDTISNRLSGPARARVVVAGDHPAERDPAVKRHPSDGRLEDRAADVVEVDVDAVRAELTETRAQRPRACNRSRRRARSSSSSQRHFAGPPAMPMVAAAFQLRDLRGGRSGGAGRAGDDDGLARTRLRDLEQSEVRRQADAAENAQVVGQRRSARASSPRRPARRVVLPAKSAHDEIAGRSAADCVTRRPARRRRRASPRRSAAAERSWVDRAGRRASPGRTTRTSVRTSSSFSPGAGGEPFGVAKSSGVTIPTGRRTSRH